MTDTERLEAIREMREMFDMLWRTDWNLAGSGRKPCDPNGTSAGDETNPAPALKYD